MSVHEYKGEAHRYPRFFRNKHPDAIIIRYYGSDVIVFDRIDDAFGHKSAPCVAVSDTALHWQHPERGGKRVYVQ